MGSNGQNFGTSITNTLGLTSPTVSPYDPTSINQQIATMQGIQNGGPLLATQAFNGMANQATGNALANTAQTKGLNPTANATMQSMLGSQMQGQAAQQGGQMALNEQRNNTSLLNSLLLGNNQMQSSQNMYQAGLQNQSANRGTSLIENANDNSPTKML